MTFLKKSNGTTRAVVPSSGTYNALVDAVSGGRFSRGAQLKAGDRTLVTVYNASESYKININAPVFFHSNARIEWEKAYLLPGHPIEDGYVDGMQNELPWGIATEEIPPGGIGAVQVSGIVNLPVSGIGQYVQIDRQYVKWVGNKSLELSPSGSARIITYCDNGYAAILLNAGAGGVEEYYDGPFAVRRVNETTIYVNPGNVYNHYSLYAQWLGSNISIASLQNGTYYVVARPAYGSVECVVVQRPTVVFEQLAKIVVDVNGITIRDTWEKGNIYADFYNGDFAVMRYADNMISVNPGTVYNRKDGSIAKKEVYASFLGRIIPFSGMIDGRYYVIVRPAQGSVECVAVSSTKSSFQLEVLAQVYIAGGIITSITNAWEGGSIETIKYTGALAMQRYSGTSISVTHAKTNLYEASSGPSRYDRMYFFESSRQTIISFDGFSDGTYGILAYRSSLTQDFDLFYIDPSLNAAGGNGMRARCGFVKIQDGELVSISQDEFGYGLSVDIYFGAFALMTDGEEVWMQGGNCSPGGRLERTDLSASNSYVFLLVKYDATDGYTMRVVQVAENSWTPATNTEVAIRIGRIQKEEDGPVEIDQYWKYGDISIVGRVV